MVVRARENGKTLGSLLLGVGIGLAIGAVSFGVATRPLQAGGGSDRAGESIVASAVVSSVYNPGTKTMIEQDGLFYLDYRSGRLLASVPELQTNGNSRHVLGGFAERDLVKDFRLEPGGAPKFLMTSGKLSEGWSPIFVFETTTGQAAVYRLSGPAAITGGASKPTLELLEVRPIPKRSVSR